MPGQGGGGGGSAGRAESAGSKAEISVARKYERKLDLR